ncbi:MAG: pyridoxal phosphate-dependent aminotransferase [Defluviicoccus sp.]|nr:pyridoxal phosphate-dependent aminotransferase [Defluviicoccus sp.]MDE0383609.1 pyridoxal phosphate-dependent aminotransferase [Defluviicoccus sp.]
MSPREASAAGTEAAQRRLLRPEIEGLGESLIRAVAEANIGRAGVIPLWFGEPDTPTPDFIKQAAVRALEANHVFYTQNRGIPPLREAIAGYAARLHHRPMGAERITVTASGMSAIMLTAQAIVAPGDNVVAVGPIWPNCVETVHVMGGETRIVALEAADGGGWRLDLDRLFDACDERTVAVMVNSPSNPTGWVMSADDQRALLERCRQRGIYVVADEVYVRLAFDLPRAPSFLDIAEPDDRLVAINSFSKSWSMTGWRLGWLTHAAELGEPFAKLNEYNLASATTFVQHAGIAAVEQGDGFIESLVERYRRNRDLVVQRLGAMRRVRLPRPDGAFYAFFAVEGMTDSLGFARELIETAGVGLAPGRAFGEAGEGRLRLCFAAEPDTLSEALDRLEPRLD